MPAGDYALGEGSVGADPVYPSENIKAPAPSALAFDPRSKDWARDDDGNPESMHPTDQAVITALSFVRGSIRSVATRGNRFFSIVYIDRNRHEKHVQGLVKEALAFLVDVGRVKILAVDVEPPRNGRTIGRVRYLNLDLPTSDPRQAERVRTI